MLCGTNFRIDCPFRYRYLRSGGSLLNFIPRWIYFDVVAIAEGTYTVQDSLVSRLKILLVHFVDVLRPTRLSR
jgi:hypothetical protein